MGKKDGASEGIRTLDTHVGNVMLYQAELRSLPEDANYFTGIGSQCKRSFRPRYLETGGEPAAGEGCASLLRRTP